MQSSVYLKIIQPFPSSFRTTRTSVIHQPCFIPLIVWQVFPGNTKWRFLMNSQCCSNHCVISKSKSHAGLLLSDRSIPKGMLFSAQMFKYNIVFTSGLWHWLSWRVQNCSYQRELTVVLNIHIYLHVFNQGECNFLKLNDECSHPVLFSLCHIQSLQKSNTYCHYFLFMPRMSLLVSESHSQERWTNTISQDHHGNSMKINS